MRLFVIATYMTKIFEFGVMLQKCLGLLWTGGLIVRFPPTHRQIVTNNHRSKQGTLLYNSYCDRLDWVVNT